MTEFPLKGLSRRDRAYAIRQAVAKADWQAVSSEQATNGDEERYSNKIASFSKCLPHDSFGEVDREAYAQLIEGLKSNKIDQFEEIAATSTLRIASPLGGEAFSILGPDSQALALSPPPPFASTALAEEMVELYWMALLRDVPFADYATDATVDLAVKDLNRLGAALLPDDTFRGPISSATLFLPDYPGLSSGPRVSQFWLWDHMIDGAVVQQRIQTPVPVSAGEGVDFLSSYDEWLSAQRGFPEGTTPEDARLDPQPRYIRNGRDLGWAADQVSITSTYLKVGMLLLSLGRAALDDGNPYKGTRVVGGLGTFDISHLQTLLGYSATARHFNFQKWRHRRLRPEALSGRVHNHLSGRKIYPIHELLLNSSALPRIYDYNGTINKRRNIDNQGTYLLPTLFGDGCATHPSYPQGHGTAAAFAVTILKAWFDEDFVLPDSLTMKPSPDGTRLEPYQAGRDGPPLTIGAELNKLVYNITWGRNLSGVHFRSDGVAANSLGQDLAIRMLAEQRLTYVEPFGGFTLTRFDGARMIV